MQLMQIIPFATMCVFADISERMDTSLILNGPLNQGGFCTLKHFYLLFFQNRSALPSAAAVPSGPVLVEIENLPRNTGTSQQDKKWYVTLISHLVLYWERTVIAGHFRYLLHD